MAINIIEYKISYFEMLSSFKNDDNKTNKQKLLIFDEMYIYENHVNIYMKNPWTQEIYVHRAPYFDAFVYISS